MGSQSCVPNIWQGHSTPVVAMEGITWPGVGMQGNGGPAGPHPRPWQRHPARLPK
ncbi:hypothetical protein B0H19DRAFT_1196186 [Mycena capillaripes]|nr:hypothetical protein B0H19DRAFT_1196186 [Mycena capillaripes]